jgi:hypothetical protein
VTLVQLLVRNIEVSERNSLEKGADVTSSYTFPPYSSVSNHTTGHVNQTKAFVT